jgi:hypothetical protein
MAVKKFIFAAFLIILSCQLILGVGSGDAAGLAKEKVDQAKICLDEMIAQNIPSKRAQEAYDESIDLYEAQRMLEEKKHTKSSEKDYALVVKYASDVCDIKDKAFEVQDELAVFKQTIKEVQKQINLSAILVSEGSEEKSSYEKVLLSFEEERFEETIVLIDGGYEELSEIESSQTTLNLFYSTTTKTIKSFFINNWKKILIISCIALVALIIFWKTVRLSIINAKIKSLKLQKDVLKNLIGRTQGEYFGTKRMSESEYTIKIQRFKDLIRDIDRKIPLLREELIKVNKKSIKPYSDKPLGDLKDVSKKVSKGLNKNSSYSTYVKKKR